MQLDLRPKEVYGLFPTDILFQTAYWSQVKSRLGWKALAFDFSTSGHSGDVLVLAKNFGNKFSAAYVPQGPEYGPEPEDYGRFLETMSCSLVKYLDPKPTFIRYDLPWESHYARDIAQGEYSAPPETRLVELRMNFGTQTWNLRKAVTNMTFADAYVVDITPSEEEILHSMKPKTRYNIRLAKKRGVHVFPASVEMLPKFYDLYRQTAMRDGFYLCGYNSFLALFSPMLEEANSPEVHFLIAAHDNDLLACAIITISGKTATYLFGASSSEKRNLMGPYAVQWAAICLARSRGCHVYDMGAISPTKDPAHPFFGLYRFKSGFGGRIVHRTGSWDYPLDQNLYNTFRNSEMMSRE